MTLPTVAVGFGAALLIGFIIWLDRRRRPRPRADWGHWPDDERDLTAIARYERARATDDRRRLDDRTWDDLNLTDVFRVLDRAESRAGQQALYARLRSAPGAPHPEAFEALVTRFETDAPARDHARQALRRMSRVDAHDLWWLAQPGSFAIERWHVTFPCLAAWMVGSAVLSFVVPGLWIALGAGAIATIALRATAAFHLRLVGGYFRQIEPMLAAASALKAIHQPATAPLTAPAVDDLPALAPLRRVARWAGRDPSGTATGELGSVLVEYLNIAVSLDGNALFFGARALRANGDALIRVVDAVGAIDAALSVASYRAGTIGWTRPVFAAEGAAVEMTGIRHPLLPDAVPNSIALAPPHGVIVTGSNMSGKTTFLRTVGVTAVLAQTTGTCLATGYEAPVMDVRSCIGRSDDPASGRSYYLVEVEAVLGLVRAAEAGTPMLILFDELFRGTNTVERIAAGEAVLTSLIPASPSARRHLVLAATHDQELVDLLADRYTPFHFSDDVDAQGLTFDYRLRPGPARTRNAIALLERRGAPADLVARARARAESFDVTLRSHR
jgi:hypothetical protein